MCVRGNVAMARFNFDIASAAEPSNWIGSILCPSSSACVDTQFGDDGHGASLPSLTPRFVGGPAVKLKTYMSTTGARRTIRITQYHLDHIDAPCIAYSQGPQFWRAYANPP